MTLNKRVEFKAPLQKGNRIQIPRLIRWEFKMEPHQVLAIHVRFKGYWISREQFYGQMSKDGRIIIPKIICGLLKAALGKQELAGAMLEVELAPSEAFMKTENE